MTPLILALIWCLLALWTLLPAVHLEEQDLNETVICTNEQIKVIIPSPFFLNKNPPVSIRDLHLNNPDCRGAEIEKTYVFTIKTNLTDCGTIMASDDAHIMFTNTIQNNESEVITTSYVNITFGCRYPANYTVQQPHGGNMIRVDIRTIILNTKDGNFSVSMLLYKDKDFKDKWTTIPALKLEDHIFVKIYMHKECLRICYQPHCQFLMLNTIPANLMLRAERCWATPNNDSHGNIQYTFIKKTCPVLTNNKTLAVIKNGQGPEALFRIQMFKFVGSSYTDIFLHCNVQICHSNSGACQPNCSGENARNRRDVALSHTVSYGPIRRLQVNFDHKIPNENMPPVGWFVLGGLLLVLLLITGVFVKLWLTRKRSYPPQEAQLALSNFNRISDEDA